MAKFILFIIFPAFLNSKICEEQYLDKLLNTPGQNYYLLVNVKWEGSGVEKMLVQRDDFFHVLSFDSKFLKQSDRKAYIKKLILKKNVFKIQKQSLVNRYFLPLATPDKRVDSLCILGKNQFLDAVFYNTGLQKDTTFDIGYLVQKLIELRVPVLFYGDAGRLIIDKTYWCIPKKYLTSGHTSVFIFFQLKSLGFLPKFSCCSFLIPDTC